MDFSTFAEKLKDVLKGGDNLPTFIDRLLCSITSNEECVKSKNNGSNRNSKTFTAYYSGERPIKPIAEAICRNESLCENKFKEYLHTIKFNNQAKSKLCEQFKEEIPDINIENLYDKLTELYVSIIRIAAGEQDVRENHNEEAANENYQTVDFEKKDNVEHIEILNGESNKSENSSEKPIIILTATISNPQAEVNDNTKSIDDLVNKLKETLDSLISIGRKIAIWQIENPWVDTDEKLESDLNEAYDKFLTLYNEIKAYNIENNTELLKNIIKNCNSNVQ